MAEKRYDALDALRGVAALGVVLYHARFASHLHGTAFAQGGYLFVDFFFVLSGFVMAHAYGDRLNRADALGPFAIRRFGRVWPLHAVMLGLFVALEAAKSLHGHGGFAPPRDIPSILPNLLLIHGLGGRATLTWNYPSWSISVEFACYLVFAVACLAFGPRRGLAAAGLSLAGGCVLLAFAPTMNVPGGLGVARALFGFFAGVVVQRAGPAPLRGTIAELATAGGAVAFLVLAHDSRWSLAAPLVFAAVVAVFANEAGRVSALLKSPPLQFVGAISYSIYMTQIFVLFRAYDLLEKRVAGNPWAADAALLASLAAIVAVSYGTFRLVEQPGRELFGRMAGRRPPPAIPEAAPVMGGP